MIKVACSLLALPEAVAWLAGGRWHWRQVMTASCPGLHAGSLPVLLPSAEMPAEPQTSHFSRVTAHVQGWGSVEAASQQKQPQVVS